MVPQVQQQCIFCLPQGIDHLFDYAKRSAANNICTVSFSAPLLAQFALQ
jgi:hypothetical protein